MSEPPAGPSVLSPPPAEILAYPAGQQPEAEPGPGQESVDRDGPKSMLTFPESSRPKKGVLHHLHHHHHNHQQRVLNGCLILNPDLHQQVDRSGRLSAAEADSGLSPPQAGRRKADASNCEVNHANQRTAEADTPTPRDELDGVGEDQSRLAASVAACSLHAPQEPERIRYVGYESELQMPDIMRLITKDLSEPYSIYTYRYFIHNWPQLCFLAMVGSECVGAIVCKLDMHKKMFRRGYIAMLAVDSKYRRKCIGTNLVKKAIYAMVEGDCDEVVLETEITNKSALKLYENLGFVRDKRLFRYYLNGVDALRLKLWLR